MKITNIKFKVTTSSWKCHKCKEKLIGEDGFIHIICEEDYGHWGGLHHIRICWNCFINIFKEIREDRKNRKSKFFKLTKKAIIRKL